MYDFQTDKKVKIPKDINLKSQEDLNLLVKDLFGYSIINLVEYDLDKKGDIQLTFFDGDDFVQDYYSVQDPKYKKLKRLLDYYFTRKSGFRFINVVEFNKVVKNADEVKSGIDYMRLSIDSSISYFQYYLDNLDFDNSNFAIDSENLITWTKLRMQHGYSIIGNVVYEGVSIPILLYTDFDEHNKKMLKSYGKIDLYGSFWRLVELGFIEPNFIEKLIKSKDFEDLDILEYSNITRLDYKIDLFYKEKTKIPDYKKILNLRKNSKIWNKHNMKKATIKEEVLKGNELQSWAYGSKAAKRVFLRVYDKLADTEAKGKYMLYQDYYNFKSVYRIEFELLNHFCKGFKYIDYKELVEKFWNSLDCRYMGKVFYNYNQEPNLEQIEQRIRYFKDFIGRGERIAEKGINPFLVLYKGLEKNGKISEKKLMEYIDKMLVYISEN